MYTRNRRRLLGAVLIAVASLATGPALAHGGNPRVTSITFPPQFPDTVWALTDNQGLFARLKDGFVWLCEDAVIPNAGLRGVAPVGEGKDLWIVASAFGFHRTRDRGCNFEDVGGALEGHHPLGLYPHPDRPLEMLTGTQTFERNNDVFRTTDGGETWTPSGFDVRGRIRTLLRAEANPDVIYVGHAEGAARSEDGGLTWSPIPLGPPGGEAAPEELALLATHPADAMEVWASLQRFPDSLVIRSRDGGATWEEMFEIADFATGLVFDSTGNQGFLVTPFDDSRRSDDGGDTWITVETPVDLLACLVREPGKDTLWSCSNIYFGGPWVVGSSDDFGETWTAELAEFRTIESVWDCSPGDDTWDNCANLCPGVAPGEPCGASGGDGGVFQPVADAGAGGAGGADGRGTDAGAGGGPAGGAGGSGGSTTSPPDASADDGGGGGADGDREGGGGGSGCATVDPSGMPLALLLMLGLRRSPRRRRARP